MSDERLRALERALREEGTDAAESAYWAAWNALGRPEWAPPPWHVRCPSILPRAGDQLRDRLVVGVRDGRVAYLVMGRRDRWNRPQLRECSREYWLAWSHAKKAHVEMLAGRKVSASLLHEHRMIAWAAAKHRARIRRVQAETIAKITGRPVAVELAALASAGVVETRAYPWVDPAREASP